MCKCLKAIISPPVCRRQPHGAKAKYGTYVFYIKILEQYVPYKEILKILFYNVYMTFMKEVQYGNSRFI